MTSKLSNLPPALCCMLALVCGPAGAQQLNYPDNRGGTTVDTYHGVSVVDPYRWLEDMDSGQVASWVAAQDKLSRAFVADSPVRGVLEERLLEMARTGRVGTPIRAGDRYFYTVTEPESHLPVVYVREDISDEPTVFYDTSHDFDLQSKRFRAIQPSPTGEHIVFHEGQGQSRWRHLLVMDVSTRTFLPERIRGFYSGRGGVAWLRDGSGFFYTRYDEPDADELLEATVKDSRVYFHKIGTTQAEDALVFRVAEQPLWLFWPRVTLDGRYLIITEASAPETRIFYKDLTSGSANVRGLLTDADATYGFEANEGPRFVFSTTLDARNSRLIEIDIRNPGRADWKELVPEDPAAGLQATSQIGGRLVMRYSKDARPLARVHDMDGSHLYDVELPTIGLIGGFADDTSNEVFYRFNSLFDPGSVYLFNVETGESTVFARPALPFDPGTFEMNQVFFHSKDGTRVPMFIAHRKGLKKNARNPVFIYGYGAYKWSAFPWYQPHVLAWMEMGGVYALPGIRGGGEYGEAWYRDGIGTRKQNGIDDYLAAAEYLVDEGYTSIGRLVANGGSASGVIAGAAIIQRPELFGAALIDVPALDMLRYHHFGSALNWVPEFGSSDDPAQFAALRAYSPYHNIEDGTCYPSTVTTVGELDDTTAPMHGYKFTAAMQDRQACDKPILLKVMWGAGHATSYGNTPEQRAANAADLLTFLVKELEMDWRGSLPSSSAGTDD